jgi:WD40 repeat protein
MTSDEKIPVTKNKRIPSGDPQDAESSPDTERIQRWRWMLEQNVPIIGGWMHRKITSALNESALAGNWLAAQSLAIVFVAHQDADVRRMAGQTLQKINYATGIDAVWGVWTETRHPGLEKIAVSFNRTAGQPASVRLLSALRLDQVNTVTHGSADLIPALIRAWGDRDPVIAERAKEALLNLHNQSSIDSLCSAWLDNRYPFLNEIVQKAGYVAQKPPAVRVLSALKTNRLEVLINGTSDIVAPLVTASQYTDPLIAERARYCLMRLQNQATVDEFCRMWSETRSPMLEEILLQAGYKARSPIHVRLLIALKTGHMITAEKVDPRGLPYLFEAANDPDEIIRGNASKALADLKDPETRESLCLLVIDKDDPRAREIAIANGYTPKTPELRALFYFLTRQWQAYDGLDFDQGMMRAIFEASSTEMRQRITAGVQFARRTDYLTILAGVDYRSRANEVNPNEAALMIRILAENGEYQRLWNLASELALPFSLEIMRILAESSWRPLNEIDIPVFEELSQLIRQPILIDGPELHRALQIAIPRANLKVKGRVNEVAFSPTRPVLAIATNQRKVVLWNFQDAVVEKVLEGFQHSVGKVSYTPQGILIAAERTSAQANCAVHVWDGHESYALCSHAGTVTSIEPVGETNLLTTGRDSQAVLWDLVSRKAVKSKEFPFWARSSAVSPDQQYAALLHDRLSLVRLPDLTVIPGYAFLPPRAEGFKIGVAQYAAFSPDGKYLLAGQYNGQVGLYYHTSLTQRPRKVLLTRHSQAIRGIHFLPGHPIVVTAGSEGQVRFFRWPEMSLQGTAFSPEGQLTSLRVSHQGAFMATGTNEASLMLWDLRVLDIPELFSLPLASATHDQVSNTLALSQYLSLPEPVRNGLRFLQQLLQYRFRFDIQIDDAQIIRYGEFDILLEDL